MWLSHELSEAFLYIIDPCWDVNTQSLGILCLGEHRIENISTEIMRVLKIIWEAETTENNFRMQK